METPGPEVAVLHPIDEEQEVLFVAELAEAQEVIRGGGSDAAFALNGFNEDGGRGGRQGVAQGVEVVVRDLPEAGEHRLEAFLDLLLAGGGDAGERASVKGVVSGEDFKAAGFMAELAGQLEEALVGLAAAVAEEALAGAQELDQPLGQAPLGFVIIVIRDVNEPPGLLEQRLGDGRVAVAQATDGDAGAEIEVALAGDIIHITAGAVAKDEVEPAITGDDVLLKERLDGRRVVANHRRSSSSRRTDFFHEGRGSRVEDRGNGTSRANS